MDLDAFYPFALTGWVAIKPDVPLTAYPGRDLQRRPLVAGTIGFEVGF